jgi:HSP20 family protein
MSLYDQSLWDPFQGLGSLQREMNRLFDGYTPERSSHFPRLNLWMNQNEAVVAAEVPGVDPKAIDVSVVKNLLTIQGERQEDDAGEEAVCHRAERGTGAFLRTVRMPFEVENEKVSATCEKGILTITLPRAEATKPKKIEIQAS